MGDEWNALESYLRAKIRDELEDPTILPRVVALPRALSAPRVEEVRAAV
jgi:hypothetical protein